MLVQQEDAQTLLRLGLTSSQAKVYLALVNLGKASGKTVWKCSGVARQDVYRVLTELQEKGLVEKTIAKPAGFKPVPMQDGLEILLKRKNKEYGEIEEKTKQFLQKLKETEKEPEITQEDSEFYLIPAKEASLQKMKKCLATAQKNADFVGSWKRIQQIASLQKDDLLKAASRGVKLRFVTTIPDNSEASAKAPLDVLKLGYEVRFAAPFSPEASMAILDGKEVLVSTEAKKPFYLDSPLLWSNNDSFALAMQHYFDLMWEKAATH